MTKINKLHFNGVDYDIGDKDIHDLTEKTSISSNDELIVADSDNAYNSKKVKYSNAIKINGLTKKDVCNENDILLIGDSTDNFSGKKINIMSINAPATISYWQSNATFGHSDTYDYYITYNVDNNTIYLYNGFMSLIGSITVSSLSAQRCNGSFILNGYVYAFLGITNSGNNYTYKLKKCKISDGIGTASNWTDVFQITISSTLTWGGEILGTDGNYIYIGAYPTAEIKKYDFSGNLVETITFSGVSNAFYMNGAKKSCYSPFGFIVMDNNQFRWVVPLTGGTGKQMKFSPNIYDVFCTQGHIYWACASTGPAYLLK